MVWLGVLLGLVTSVSWAIGNVLTQRLGRLIGPSRAMLWALGAGGVLALPFALALDSRTEPFGIGIALWTIIAAIGGIVAYVGLFHAFANESLTVAVPIVSSWPVAAAVVSIGLLGETLQRSRLPGTAAVLAGVILVSIPKKTEGAGAAATGSKKALVAAFASSLGFGVMIPAMGRIAPATGAFGASVIVYALGIVLALGLGRTMGVSLAPPPRSAWGLVLATGAVETMGFVAVALARRFAPMTLVAPVASLAATFTVLYAWIVLRERPRVITAIGALAAGVGVALLAM